MQNTPILGLKKFQTTDVADLTQIGANFDIIEDELTRVLNEYPSVADGNGIYTVVDYKHQDGTLHMKSTLSNYNATSKTYGTDTWKYYAANGTTVVRTITWTLTYDASGNLTNKVAVIS